MFGQFIIIILTNIHTPKRVNPPDFDDPENISRMYYFV